MLARSLINPLPSGIVDFTGPNYSWASFGPGIVTPTLDLVANPTPNTNLCLQSQALATSPWNVGGSTTAPTITNNAAVAPDGTSTATQGNFAAISGSNQYSYVYQSFTGTAASYTLSLWIRTVSGTGTFYIGISNSSTTEYHTACNVTTTWQKFTVTGTLTAASWVIVLGPDGYSFTGQPTSQPALNCYIWGAQVEQSSTPSTYSPTTITTTAVHMISNLSGAIVSPATDVGGPTLTSSPYYPSGFSGSQQMAVALNGTSQYLSLGDIVDDPNNITMCLTLYAPNVTSNVYPFIKDFGIDVICDVTPYSTNYTRGALFNSISANTLRNRIQNAHFGSAGQSAYHAGPNSPITGSNANLVHGWINTAGVWSFGLITLGP